ncbi:SDR family oxidoreductase [Geminicoccus harenae]|uniref:SDR family oxidoreductase n=2 Tax=Geminicoccus harenae TaxID=2498453 RepID=UPI001C948E44|nr:SDR family oxidoreductase [Geminicoccus harenae]
MFQFASRPVAITGAGGGIGRRLVARFVEAGAAVIAFDRTPEMLADLPGIAFSAAFQMGDRAGAEAAIAAASAAVGPIKVLVNNAGGARAETLTDMTHEKWDEEVALNLTGTFQVTTPVLAAMRETGGGSIVTIGTVNALMHFGNPGYAAAKAGLVAYTKAIATEQGRFGIRANIVCPGSTRTPAWNRRIEKDPTIVERLGRHYPIGRMVEPDEVASAVLFLASDLASGISGAVLPVDGGLMAGMKAMTEVITSETF